LGRTFSSLNIQQLEYVLMKENPNATATKVPLHALLRRRRKELHLTQAEVANAVHVTAEAVTSWESGKRRMELSKIPRIAAALQLNAKELCAKALGEFHPIFFAALLSDGAVVPAHLQHMTA
jgi:DNA-binding XRE family transcriptional regulator